MSLNEQAENVIPKKKARMEAKFRKNQLTWMICEQMGQISKMGEIVKLMMILEISAADKKQTDFEKGEEKTRIEWRRLSTDD